MKIGPKYKIARRLGDRIFSKCQSTKFTVSGTERKTRGGKKGHRAMSEFGRQLIEKQKARFTYGVTEKQFANYVQKAQARKQDSPTVSLFKILENRLDNIVYRLGLAKSRLNARQMVSHGHITVNGRKVSIPSMQMKIGDKVSVRPASRDKALFKDLAERSKDIVLPDWLVFDFEKMEGQMKNEPTIGSSESNLDFGNILEFYSRV